MFIYARLGFLKNGPVVTYALECSEEDPDIYYQLEKHKEHLIRLCLTWEPMIRIIPVNLEASWGPSLEELDNARAYELVESVVYSNGENNDWAEDDDYDDNVQDAALLDSVEVMALADEFRSSLSVNSAREVLRGISPVKQSRKR